MDNEIIVCIPGTWENRTKFIESVAVSTSGDFVFAGMILAHPKGNDHVELEFYDAHEQMASNSRFGKSTQLNVVQISYLTVQGVHRGKELNFEQAADTLPELGLRAQAATDLAKQSPASLHHLVDREGKQHQQG